MQTPGTDTRVQISHPEGTCAGLNPPLPAFPDSTPTPARQINRVLVVDASPGICQQVGLALSGLKMEVNFADTIDEAHLRARSEDFQLLIIDVAVNDAAGYKFCYTLSQDPVTCHIPVIAFTARKSWYSRIKVKLAGCRAYLPKPTRLDEFCRVVQDCLHATPEHYPLNAGHS